MRNSQMDLLLKETGQLTGASWAIWLERSNNWEVLSSYKVNLKQHEFILKFILQPPIKSWLNRALSGKRSRSRPNPKKKGLPGKRIYIYTDQVTQRVILVAADELLAAAQRFWRIVALGNSGQSSNDLEMEAVHFEIAGLLENGRLRQEADDQARNLNLIHDVVEKVIGQTDVRHVAQIAAELLAQDIKYELIVVAVIRGPKKELQVAGISGSEAGVIQKGLKYIGSAREDGIVKRVAATGESELVNDVRQDSAYLRIPDWDAGSEMCVALKDGDLSFGIIDIESRRKKAFSNNDLLVLESLAGIIASVISNVGQNQKQQMTEKRLSATQAELQEHIAAQRMAERRLVQAAKLAAVGEMAAGIAHELNNPLTTVCGFTELTLEEVPSDSRLHADLELVLREAHRATEVVRRLLDFARQSESERTRSNINEIVEEVLALVNHLFQTGGVQLITEFPNGLPLVSVDRNQVKQVILNLIHNALHAMPNGGELHLSCDRRSRDHQDWVTLTVTDTGVGISPENLERIFVPFFTTRSKEGGTGLGLSISYGIIADHGGFIEAESQVGKGSIFSIWIPVEVN
ncbi:MAG TPA: ATP-binding protein [Anaerolineales bacterium]